MYLSRKADYGLRLVYELAHAYPGERISTREVAERQCIPEPFLAKITSDLAHRGLVITQRGSGGGLILARDPADITFLDVIEALDGPVVFAPCQERSSMCCWAEQCAIEPALMGARDLLVDYLRNLTFAEVLAERTSLELTHPVAEPVPERAG